MFVEQLTDESDDSVVGKSNIACTMHIGSWAICTGTFNITGRGEIVGQGLVPFGQGGSSFDVPVTGGTGEFANVRGEVHIEPILSETEERHTLELIPEHDACNLRLRPPYLPEAEAIRYMFN